MPNSLEPEGRGLTDRQLFASGVLVLFLIAVITVTLLAKSTGRLNRHVRVVAELSDVGDGLPQKSDVKYRGVLVGEVNTVIPAANGDPNHVHIDLKPAYARSIPETVTARVVPSNVFAVSSVQLVDAESGPPIGNGDHIAEDTRLPTVLFETTITKLRDILTATGRGREDHTVGLLAALGAATDRRRTQLLASGAQLTRLLDELNAIVATDTGPSTVSALLNAAHGLSATAPELLDALHRGIRPMQTFAEERRRLHTLISGGLNTLGTARQALDNHIDQLIEITTDLTPVTGVLAVNADQFVPIFTRLNLLSDTFFDQVWLPELNTPNMRMNLSLTPSYSYTRADCPRYGQLAAPSCVTAPEIAVRPDLPAVLLPQNFQPPPELAPPAGTVVGPNGDLTAAGPPLVEPDPNPVDPNPPIPPGFAPAPPVPGTAHPAGPASFGGNVGPVGSPAEADRLAAITGQPATAATHLLLGPVARGTVVSLRPRDGVGRPR